MTPRNFRTSRSFARSSRSPLPARAVRSAHAAQSGRIAPRSASPTPVPDPPPSSDGYRPAYQPGSQGPDANDAYSRHNPGCAKFARKMSRGKKVAIGLVTTALIAVVGAGTAFAFWASSASDHSGRGTKAERELGALQDVLAPAASPAEPFYVMLVGIDRHAGSDSTKARSEANIVMRVDPNKKQLTLLSIPCDMKVELDGRDAGKFGAAYGRGGTAAVIAEAGQLLGIGISHYVEVGFDELPALVDALGGVYVEVDRRIDDPKAGDVVIEAGVQHLDGVAATAFARSRAYIDGDLTRMANQRKLVGAIVDRLAAVPESDFADVVQGVAPCVTTDLSPEGIVTLAGQFEDKADLAVYAASVPLATGSAGSASFVHADEAALAEMMEVVEEGGDPGTIAASAPVRSGA